MKTGMRELGKLYDVLLIISLKGNPETSWPMDYQADVDENKKAHYRMIAQKIDDVPSLLRPFYWLGDTGSNFMMQYFFKHLQEGLSLNELLKRMNRDKMLIPAILQYYIPNADEMDRETVNHILDLASIAPELKHQLYMFYIHPVRVKQEMMRMLRKMGKAISTLEKEVIVSESHLLSLLHKAPTTAPKAAAPVTVNQVTAYSEEMQSMGKVFSDKNRVQIVEYLLRYKRLTAAQLAKQLGLPLNTVWYHVMQLEELNVCETCTEGREVFYSLSQTYFKTIIEQLEHYLA